MTAVVGGRPPRTIPSRERGRVEMRRVRFGDGTGAVTGVSDGGDLEGIPFLPPAPPTGPTGTAAVPGAAPVPGNALVPIIAPVPGIGPMPVVAPALPAAAAASNHSIGSPAPNAAAGEVGPTGATPDQVRQALNASNLSVTGAGFTGRRPVRQLRLSGRGGGGRSQRRAAAGLASAGAEGPPEPQQPPRLG
jgi:hypothetical protein